jgi:hypothetical protein
MCFDIGLEFQPRFPGRCGQGFHSSVVHVTAAIEHHLLDPGSAGALSNFFPITLAAATLLPPLSSLRVSLSIELAEASVRPLRSSTTCA